MLTKHSCLAVTINHFRCAQALRDSLAGVLHHLQGSLLPAVRDFNSPSASATLAYEEIAAPGAPQGDLETCILVHGLLGSGRNWRTFARRLVGDALSASSRQATCKPKMLVKQSNVRCYLIRLQQ